MKKQPLFLSWAALFIVCAALGFIPAPTGGVRTALTLLGLSCFVPPALLVYGAVKTADKDTLLLVRNLSIASLSLTALLLALNFASVLGSKALGDFLYCMLLIVSSPMECVDNWALSMFLWACLLMVTLKFLKKK